MAVKAGIQPHRALKVDGRADLQAAQLRARLRLRHHLHLERVGVEKGNGIAGSRECHGIAQAQLRGYRRGLDRQFHHVARRHYGGNGAYRLYKSGEHSKTPLISRSSPHFVYSAPLRHGTAAIFENASPSANEGPRPMIFGATKSASSSQSPSPMKADVTPAPASTIK